MYSCGLGLYPVEGEKGLAFAGVQHKAIGEPQAAEFAGVLLQVVVPCGETARGVGQRQTSPGQHFGFDGLCEGVLQGADGTASQLGRHHPAPGPPFLHQTEGVRVEDV